MGGDEWVQGEANLCVKQLMSSFCWQVGHNTNAGQIEERHRQRILRSGVGGVVGVRQGGRDKWEMCPDIALR